MMTTNERAGYDAAALEQPLDTTKPADWQAGWQQYQDDMTRSETQRYA